MSLIYLDLDYFEHNCYDKRKRYIQIAIIEKGIQNEDFFQQNETKILLHFVYLCVLLVYLFAYKIPRI